MNVAKDNRSHYFFIVDDAIIDTYGKALGPYGVALYCAMARCSSKEGTLFASVEKLAASVGISRRKAVDVISLLESLGLISKEPRVTEDGRQTSHLYTMHSVQGDYAPRAGGTMHAVQGDYAQRAYEVNTIEVNTIEEDIPTSSGDASQSQQATPPSKRAKIETTEAKKELTQKIFAAYNECIVDHENGSVVSYPRVMRAAKHAAAKGVDYTKIHPTFVALKAQKFWANKHLSLEAVLQNIGAVNKASADTSGTTISEEEAALLLGGEYVSGK